MKSMRNHQWSNSERLDLLKICSDEAIEKDWVKRADFMAKKYSMTALGYFFTAKTCHAEIERILSSPCPGIEPNTSGQYSYSHKVMMEKWIAHYTAQIEQDKDRKVELAMVEVRKCTSLIEKCMDDKMSLAEMGTLLEQLTMENPKREEDFTYRRVVSTYSNRLLHIWKEGGLKRLEDPTQLGATKQVDPPSSESSSGFMTPTYPAASSILPSLSTVSSPIRSVAEALKEAVPIFAEPNPPSPVKTDRISTPVALLSPVKTSPIVVPEKVEEPVKEEVVVKDEVKEEPAVDAPKQRGRPRLKPLPNKAATTPARDSTPSSEPPKTKRAAESSVEPAKKMRLSSVAAAAAIITDTPTSGKTRKRAEIEDRKSRSTDFSENSSTPATPLPPTSDSFTKLPSVDCQTNISIRNVIKAAPVPNERRKSSAAVGSTRKSTRREAKSNVSQTSTTPTPAPSIINKTTELQMCSVGCQTGRVEFDKEDVVIVDCHTVDTNYAEIITIDETKTKMELDEEIIKEIEKETEDDSEEGSIRRGSKSESRRELRFVIDTDEPIAKQMIREMGYKQATDVGDTPIKRMRKDEKTKEETTNMKLQLNNMWRALSDHKHSGIFSHPVTEKDAPGYNATVKNRVDLAHLKKDIESGVVASKSAFMLKVYTMFANAVMFNSTGHDVNTYAKMMMRDVMSDILSTSAEERKPGRRAKIVDEARDAHRSRSMEPEPMVQLGVPGSSRAVFSRPSTRHTKKTNHKT